MEDQFSQPMQRARAAVRALHRLETLTRTSSARRSRPSDGHPDGPGTMPPVDIEAGPDVSAERASSWNPGQVGHHGLLASTRALNASQRRRNLSGASNTSRLPGEVGAATPDNGAAVPQDGAAPEGHEAQLAWQRMALPVISALHFQRAVARRTQSSTGEATRTAPPVPGHAPGLLPARSDARVLLHLFTSNILNVLLLAIPFGWAAHFAHWPAIAVFVLNLLGLVPLALALGELTEDLAIRFGEVVGGLLNATFGNVVELILSIAALTKGLFTVVAMSLLGSVLSNLLLVLGCCFLFGGTRFKEQSFNMMVNKACCSLLFMACIALTIPTAAAYMYSGTVGAKPLANLSHATAIILAFIYLCYLLFTLKTHSAAAAVPAEGEVPETPALSLGAALLMLGGITVVVAVCSEFLTGALEEVSQQSGLGQAFLGLIVLPIAGNACEHITAVFVAWKNKMDLAIGVALGSSIQISTFVLPLVVLVGWIIGTPFYLNFDPFVTIVLTLSVIHAYFVSSDGNSNWLMGVQLIGTYLLIALLYLFVPNFAPNTNHA
ncbi:hypothetical protein WJX81_004642 [Elliptochloris bilobata]|uniref:Vacuolar cation/proton exchanger n=1 Tax=Elliptochloris bilobata TaxID=381761 RepID=A0AAW1QD96_9CHLO